MKNGRRAGDMVMEGAQPQCCLEVGKDIAELLEHRLTCSGVEKKDCQSEGLNPTTTVIVGS